ncbi:decarboxylating 6-phosphogluconate dehydrogenase [Desulfoprunum benzoelyticum]|uniref:6-phosphogluconate dehydrogenase n=1 Tax=Desulfoprunum benzoelyticum TaxID=1506996 RepID=A0A840URU4_9BACT|nr:decarboxylating 6-phosphogluconate dehydrogenase [Desulfoprunum benzoelyticum]MBB5348502.1 6-phosphogluconate dehydrogenase [Desulfoprunum benzoelyticum]MBM9530163.1 decarboxylating 6-phosphogluconate dehydrogenase [Desulfoprunum benzoelyticum]
MELGIIGMGKMGLPLALNGRDKGLDIVVHTTGVEKLAMLEREGVRGFARLEEFTAALRRPRAIWLMVPAGKAVDDTIARLLPLLEGGDCIIDGGNSHYRDSQRRHQELGDRDIHFLDVGTSGGTGGARNGACLMIGGDAAVYAALEPVFVALSGGMGCALLGPSGAGHYVKMIHNGIEYGMMQAIGEGLEILRHGPLPLELDRVTAVWQRGSIVSGLLLDVTAAALAREPGLESIQGIVAASGEANWTVEEAVRIGVSAPVIATALFSRFKSQDKLRYAEKTVAAMRREFGGHSVVADQGE